MSAIVACTRVSTDVQTCENQRRTISACYAVGKWLSDDGGRVRSLLPGVKVYFKISAARVKRACTKG